METWTITLDDGTIVESVDVTAAHVVAVSDLAGVGDTWAVLDPSTSPNILMAWVALLTAERTEVKDVQMHIQRLMTKPITDLINMYNKE